MLKDIHQSLDEVAQLLEQKIAATAAPKPEAEASKSKGKGNERCK